MEEYPSQYPVGSNEWYYDQIVNDSKQNPNNRTFTIAHVPKNQKAAVSKLLREGFVGNERDKRLAEDVKTFATIDSLAGLASIPAVQIDPVIITPQPWQEDYFKNFGNKELRSSLPKYIHVGKISRDIHKVQNEFKSGNISVQELQDKQGEIYSRELDPDLIYNATKNLYNIWNAAGRPKIIQRSGRPKYFPILNRIYIDDNFQLVSELAHPILQKYTQHKITGEQIFQTLKGELGNREHYHNPYHYEYKTHKIVEPGLWDYILGENPSIEKLWNKDTKIQKHQDGEIISKVKNSSANFVERLKNHYGVIKDTEKTAIIPFSADAFYNHLEDGERVASHKLSYVTHDDGTATVYPEVQMIDGKLIDFNRIPYDRSKAYDSAIERQDTVRMPNEEVAKWFTENYKKYFKGWIQ